MKKTIRVVDIINNDIKMEVEINNDCGVIVKLIKYDKAFNNLIQEFIVYKDNLIADNYKKVSSAELVNMITSSLETLTERVVSILELNCSVDVK